MNTGKIVQIAGPVVDVEFPDSLPGIYNALSVEYKVDNQPIKLTLEVQQHLGDGWVRTISMPAWRAQQAQARAAGKRAPNSRPSTFPRKDFRETPNTNGLSNFVNRLRAASNSRLWTAVLPKPIPGSSKICSRATPAPSKRLI